MASPDKCDKVDDDLSSILQTTHDIQRLVHNITSDRKLNSGRLSDLARHGERITKLARELGL